LFLTCAAEAVGWFNSLKRGSSLNSSINKSKVKHSTLYRTAHNDYKTVLATLGASINHHQLIRACKYEQNVQQQTETDLADRPTERKETNADDWTTSH